MNQLSARHQIQRVRQETRRRRLHVAAVEHLTPHMRRLRFVSDDLHDFDSFSPDDHIKLFLPMADGTMCKRDYTPRWFDAPAGELVIDFALHLAGPATAWASRAVVGDTLEIGGPRGSTILPDDFDWYWLIGDETALPSIGRRVEALRPGAMVASFVVVDSAAEIQHLATRADWRPFWVYRAGSPMDDAALLQAAMRECDLPEGDGFVCIAAEAAVAHSIKGYMTETRGHPAEWLKSSGYWVRGTSGD